MTLRAVCRIAVLLAVLGAALGVAGQPNAAPSGARTSSLSLWTAAQLREPSLRPQAGAERAIRHLSRPDTTPPARTEPLAAPHAPARPGVIRRVALPEADRRVALTFDLCERSVHVTGYDARLVDVLRAGNAKASFFAGGKWLRSHPERALQLMADPRFELGNHAWTHANMAVAAPDERRRQTLWTSAQYELLREELDRRLAARGLPASGLQPLALFRLPYGRGGPEVWRELNALGLSVIQWDVVGEAGGGTPRARAQAVAQAVRPGSIVLFHANCVPRDTALVLRELLPLLARRGYSTATVSELLRAGAPEAVDQGWFTTPGDNAIYDHMFEDAGTGARSAKSPGR